MASVIKAKLEQLYSGKSSSSDSSDSDISALCDPDATFRPLIQLDWVMGLMRTDSGSAFLDWEQFETRERSQPLRILASSVSSGKAISLGRHESSWKCADSLIKCLQASCFLPGIAGAAPVAIETHGSTHHCVDAVIYEPIPYRAALEEGCTHVVVLRTWPDETPLPVSFMNVFERVLAPKSLRGYPGALDFLLKDLHSRVYAEDMIHLSHAANGLPLRGASVLPVAIPASEPLSQMELSRDALRSAMVDGFAQAFDVLSGVADPAGHKRDFTGMSGREAAEERNFTGKSGSEAAEKVRVFGRLDEAAAVRNAYSGQMYEATREGEVGLIEELAAYNAAAGLHDKDYSLTRADLGAQIELLGAVERDVRDAAWRAEIVVTELRAKLAAAEAARDEADNDHATTKACLGARMAKIEELEADKVSMQATLGKLEELRGKIMEVEGEIAENKVAEQRKKQLRAASK
ncbi:hypothetical protein T484DRAFT_1788356 [Baffinella frigidus]|nr:hypothetical protein T484DRAFT_1788356 [Cryptophyta sp. CCMP2293]